MFAARGLLSLVLLAACSESDDLANDPGALIDLTMQSTTGVLLDELPMADRDRIAQLLIDESEEFWLMRAIMQVETTAYRLTYRNLFVDGAGQLPLPPREQWMFVIGTPQRRTIDGHDLVVVDYTFSGTLLSAPDQPGIAEPALAKLGGTHEETFTLPADPELLFQRTGYACMDEEDFPPGSVDSENARSFFDDTCEGGSASPCHVTEAPSESCVEALQAHVGTVQTAMHFERRRWSSERADAVRLAEQTPGGPQLTALESGLDDHRIVYRYFPADSCAIAEGCVGGPGWRRLLQFTASMHNSGDEDVVIGDVGPGSPAVSHNMVSYSECHGHMHFNHYGDFRFGEGSVELGSKRAFCLESTTRYSNTELSPLVHDYSCHYQGTAAGWSDDYIAGLECQWIDITSVTSKDLVIEPLIFEVNPDGFLCEGQLQRDADGQPLFEPTEFVTEQGDPESRFVCEPREGWADDNTATAMISVMAEGGLVTDVCTRGQLGEKRNCGFTKQRDHKPCTAGEETKLSCWAAPGAPAQVLRICETSKVLGLALPCTYRDSLANLTIGEEEVEVAFECPNARDEQEPGGAFSMYTAPAYPGDPIATVTCI